MTYEWEKSLLRSFKESCEWQCFEIVKELNDKEFYDYMKLYRHIIGLGDEKEMEILITFSTLLGMLQTERENQGLVE